MSTKAPLRIGIVVGLVTAVASYFILLAVLPKKPSEAAGDMEPAPEWRLSDVEAARAAFDPENPPRINVEQYYYDVGVVEPNAVGGGRLIVRNTGGSPLVIEQVTTPCNCTIGRMEDNVIPPGGESGLRIAFDPRRVMGFEAERTLTIHSNDPKNPEVPIHVMAKVNPEIEIPLNIEMGAFEASKGGERTVRIRQLQDDPFDIIEMKVVRGPEGNPLYVSPERFDIAYREVPESEWLKPDHREYELTLYVHPNQPAGEVKTQVMVQSNLPRLPVVLIHVTYEVVEDLLPST